MSLEFHLKSDRIPKDILARSKSENLCLNIIADCHKKIEQASPTPKLNLI